MSDRYTFRRAKTTDLDRLVELLLALQDHVEASNPTLWQMKSEARANFKGQLAARLKAKDACALVAEHEEEGVVGVIFGRVVANKRYKPDRTGQVDHAFVRVEHRRTGVGTQLVAELCHFFAERGIEDISLRYVVGNNEAASFWISLGFSPRILTVGAHRKEIEARLATCPEP
jgi:ribosomal protein S18 acetylase RimI-like enzyme